MRSQWYKHKDEAIKLRRNGASLRDVEKKLNIPRSTLSYWFKDVTLSSFQKAKLFKNWQNALGKARIEAVKWHNEQKQIRLKQARTFALKTLSELNTRDTKILEISLAMLYLGEGAKTSLGLSLGNTNSLILKFFISSLELVYGLDRKKIHCELHLRHDQNALKIKEYWSNELNIPIENFTSVAFDLRTKGSKTYFDYKGVCVLRCSNTAIQRRLMYLAEEFCNKIILQ
jgi:hypothetical protein